MVTRLRVFRQIGKDRREIRSKNLSWERFSASITVQADGAESRQFAQILNFLV